jgi:diguanylate cyclase (GGDEF)-like protein/PAS domain S-box-containing protein
MCIFADKTDDQPMDAIAQESNERPRLFDALFRAAFESAPVGMIVADDTGSIALVNMEAERMFGYERNELLSMKIDVLVPDRYRSHHPNHRERFSVAPDARPMGNGRELFGLRKDRTEFPTEIGLSPIQTDDGLFILSAIVDITKRKQLILAKEKAEVLATHDFLTGLPNRVLLLDRVTQALALAKRKKRMVALLSLDIDDFKKVNDTYGHGIGDRLLIEVAARMRNALRDSDTVTRLGGDEFLLLAPEIESTIHAETLATHILEKVRQPFDLGELTLWITFSLGVALYPRHGTTPQTLMANSDGALYLAKGRGKNCFALAQ